MRGRLIEPGCLYLDTHELYSNKIRIKNQINMNLSQNINGVI